MRNLYYQIKLLMGIIQAIDIVIQKGWRVLWMQKDSLITMKALSNSSLVNWKLMNRRNNVLKSIKGGKFRFSHIFRERNRCANRLC